MIRLGVRYRPNGALGSLIRNRVYKAKLTVTKAIIRNWEKSVDSTDLSPRAKDKIKRSIKPYWGAKVGAYIDDKVAKLLELGWRSFDMKPGLLAGQPRRVIPLKTDAGVALRIVSHNSPADSWVHPGFRGAKSRANVLSNLQNIVNKALKNASK